MLRLTGTIEGMAPLLFSRPFKVIEGKSPGKLTDQDREEEPTKRLHRDEHGVYIPHGAIKAALLEGVTIAGIKDGKRSARPLIEATLFPQHHLYLGKETYDRVYETWARVPPRTGPVVLIRYPLFDPGWCAQFEFIQTREDKALSENIQAALKIAGELIGIGSWRPEYGRFILTDWQVDRWQGS